MWKTSTGRLAAVVGLLCLSGCPETIDHPADGGTVDGGDPGTQSLEPAQFCDALTDVACSYWKRCGFISSIENCKDWYWPDCVSENEAAAADPRQGFDRGVAAECTRQLRSEYEKDRACIAAEMPEACDRLFSGKVADGSACYESNECAYGSFCTSISTGTCPGVCSPGLPEGPDNGPGSCAPGLYSLGGRCVKPAEAGASCAPPPSGSSQQQCVPGFNCDSASLRCVADRGVGQSCVTAGCQQFLVCANGVCARRSDKGEPCGEGDDSVRCMGDLRCVSPKGVTGTCETGALDAPCMNPSDCNLNLYCDRVPAATSPGRCKPMAGSGSSCWEQSGTCGAGLYCNHSSGSEQPGTCEPKRGQNEICSSSNACSDGFYCSSGICVRQAQTGDPCTPSTSCEQGYCSEGVCAAWSWSCEAP